MSCKDVTLTIAS